MKHAVPGALLRLTVVALTAPVLSCSSATSPESGLPATVLVINTTCDPGPCIPLSIRGIIPKFAVPGQPPAGFLVVGTVDAASACLTIPASDSLVVNSPEGTTVTRWTQADPVSLTASNAMSMSVVEFPIGETAEFTPASAPGWRVSLPGDTTKSAVVEKAERCGT
jgi:hypothetical protein